MTPLRVGALAVSLVLLVGAIWLVFVGVPNNATPQSTAIANVPNASDAAPSQAASTAAAQSGAPSSAAAPGASASAPALSLNPLLKEVPAHSVDPAELTGYIWPVKHSLISSRFQPRIATEGGFVIINGQAVHDGVDLVTHCDDKVRAAHDGTVLYAGRNYDPYLGYQGDANAIYDRLQKLGRTNEQAIVVVVDDGNGYRSVYVHLNEADVEPGAVLQAGDVIGLEGATGFASGCHLHYTLIRMDGGWQQVVDRLLPFGYPPLVRERIDPLNVLPWGDPDAPQRLQDRVNPPSPTPISTVGQSPIPIASGEPSTESSGLATSPSPFSTPTTN